MEKSTTENHGQWSKVSINDDNFKEILGATFTDAATSKM